MKRLENKVCVVTGAARGIGEGVAKRFAQEGAAVLIVDRNEEGLKRVSDDIRDQGGEVDFFLADVIDEEQIKQIFLHVDSCYGSMHVLNTNPWWSAKKKVTELTLDEWNRSLAVTLTAPFLCSKYAIPLMQKAGGGSIIHTSSVGGVVAFREDASYITAKAGVIHLCKSIAVDYGQDNIRSNAICPGIIETPDTRSEIDDPEYSKYLLSKCLTGRIGNTQDIAAAAAFLASDESSFITGSVLMVDSGWSVI